jgi:hypothetical protein
LTVVVQDDLGLILKFLDVVRSTQAAEI